MPGFCQRNLSAGTVKSASNLSRILCCLETFLVHSAAGAKLQHNAPTRADGLPTSSKYGLPNPLVSSSSLRKTPRLCFPSNLGGYQGLSRGFPCLISQSYSVTHFLRL